MHALFARATTVWCVLVMSSAANAAAQRPAALVDLGTAAVRLADTVSVAALAVSPAVRFESPRVIAGVHGTWSQASEGWTTQGGLDLSSVVMRRGRWAAELAGNAGGSAHHDGTRTGQFITSARAHFEARAAGAWIGAGAGRTWDGAAARVIRQGEAGIWRRPELVNATLTMSASVLPTAVDDSLRYTDLLGATSLEGRRFDVEGVIGARLGSRFPAYGGGSRLWGGVNVVSWLRPRVAIVAAAGSYAVDPTQGFPAGRYLSLSLRLAGRPRTSAGEQVENPRSDPVGFEAIPASGGRHTLRVHSPGARRVELMGDFTGWRAVALNPASGGWWTITLPIARGVHQLNTRSNGGEWRAPAGVPTLRDEFGGVVGILTIP